MDGGNRLWLHARMFLSRDDTTYAAFQSLYETGCAPQKARDWWVDEDISTLLSRYEVVPLDATNDPDFQLSPDSDKICKLETDLAQPGDYNEEGEEVTGEVPMRYVASAGIRQLGVGIHAEGCAVLPTSYSGQACVKIDPVGEHLILEMIEAAPMLASNFPWPMTAEEARKTIASFEQRPGEDNDDDDDEREMEEEELFYNEKTDRLTYYFMSAFCSFRESRVLRMRIDMNNISSLILMGEPCSVKPGDEVEVLLHKRWRTGRVTTTPKIGSLIEVEYTAYKNGEPYTECTTTLPQYVRAADTNRMGVLVVETISPVESFASRAVYSSNSEFNPFSLMGDWTPDCSASEALRYYIVGSCRDLRKIIVELVYLRDDLVDCIANPTQPADEVMPDMTPLCDVRPPALRRMPFFGKIDGIEEAKADLAEPSITAGHSSELTDLLEDMQKKEMEEDERDMKQLTGTAENPDFQFPKRPDTKDNVITAAQDFLEGRKAAAKPAPTEVEDDIPLEPEAQGEPGPAPVEEAPTAVLCPPFLGSQSWSCGNCGKKGLLAWVRRCPGCAMALAPKGKKTGLTKLKEMAKGNALPKPAATTSATATTEAAAKTEEDVPENWEDGI